MRKTLALLFVAALTLATLATPAGADTRRATCAMLNIPTSQGTVAAQYCTPQHGNGVTQVLVHGATYNHDYWDWPQFHGAYSYVRRANDAGYTTLAIDRIGDGHSYRPALAVNDTYTVQVQALHNVMLYTRQRLAGRRGQVEMVGHSYGSLYVEGDLAVYPDDADAAILTGSGHAATAEITAISRADTEPAALLGGRFAGLDAGYLTSVPGTRAALVYDPAKADLRVITLDEATEDVMALGEIRTRPVDQGALSIQIQVPVLLMDGDTDNHYCGPDVDDCTSQRAFHASEAPFFSPAAHLSTVLVDSGHDIQLSYVSAFADTLMLAWSHRTLNK